MQNASSASTVLAKAASDVSWAALPRDVRTRTLELFLDAIAVIAGAVNHPTMQALTAQVSPADGPSTLVAGKCGAATREAILLNAGTTTVLQRQDGFARAKGHPASQLTPVLLALAEREGASADALLSAFVAGYEVGARVGIALGGVPPWLHDNGNWATIGTAAGAAHLLTQGDANAVAGAIDGAASLALSFDRLTTAAGATLHHLYPAMATTHALSVAEGAAAGLTALPGSLERFYGPHLGAAFSDSRLQDGIEKDRFTHYEVLNGYFKLHPSCAHLHGVNDAVEHLVQTHGLSDANVAHVEVAVFGEAMEIDSEAPCNDLAARFSAKATVAAALKSGSLEDDALLDVTTLQPVMDKVSVRHDPALDQHTPEGRPGRVTIKLTSGETVQHSVIHPRGTPTVNATDEEREGKALTLLLAHFSDEEAVAIMDAVRALGDGGSVEALSAALRSETS